MEEEQALPEPLERDIASLTAVGGEPLPPPLRRDMEGRLGIDLGSVRVHRGAEAARLSDRVHAHAFTVGDHLVFNRGRFQPEHPAGRRLLAHELAHVAQARGDAGRIEHEVESRAGARQTPPERAPKAQQIVRRGFWSDLYNSAADALGDIANWAVSKVREYGWRLLERISPAFARTVRAILDEGILSWLGKQVARAWDVYIATLRRLVPFEGPRQLIDLFAGLVERAARIAAALVSGNCKPLMAAIKELKTFVTQTVGVAWQRLTAFLRPVGDFFTGLWRDFGAPAIRWLRDFGGSVWTGIQALGRRLWSWIRPVRDAAARIWNWFKDLLFGPSTGNDTTASQGGVVGWITTKAGEAWDWVKARTRPVWQPVVSLGQKVARLIPPAFVRDMGQHAQQLSTELNSTAAGMGEGDGVPRSRTRLNQVLPSVKTVIASVRRIIVGAGNWLAQQIGDIAGVITGLIGRLRANTLLSWLAGAFSFLTVALDSLLSWARQKVVVLFDWMVRGFDALSPFLELVLQTVRKVISIYPDLLQLPLLVLSGIWRRVPACIREPVERFIKTQILSRIPVFGQFFSDPQLWPRVRETALGILRRLFVNGDIAGAAWAFFQAVLRILGVPARLVVQILAKAASAIGQILTNPIGFLINTLRAIRAGFGRFFGNIGRHLLGGVTGWLFGRLQEAGINPPGNFSLRSVLGFVLEALGITADNIFGRLARRVGRTIVDRLRRMLDMASGVWSFVATLVREGPAGLWRTLQERLSSLWDTVVQGVIGWITERVIARASRWLLSLLDPSGIMAVINSLTAIYNAIQSFVEYLERILQIVNRVLDGILDIARGVIAGAAGHLENALAAALPVAIGFLARQLGLGNLSRRIREILQRVQGVVNRAIDWLIDRALRLGRALLDMARRGIRAVRRGAARLREWWRTRLRFRGADGRQHSLYFRGRGSAAQLTVESTPMGFQTFLNGISDPSKATDKAEAQRLYNELRAVQRVARPGTPSGGATGAGVGNNDAEIVRLTNALAPVAARLMSGGAVPPASAPRYGSLRQGFGRSVDMDTLTSHIPPGSEPSVESALWNRLKRRKVGDGTYYIRGHLLNHHVGGPGYSWANLTPITGSANTTMSSQVEEPAKRAVAAGAVLEYRVEAVYPRNLTKNQALLNRINQIVGSGTPPPELAAKRDVIQAEQDLPSEVKCTTKLKDGVQQPRPAGFSDKVNHPIPNTIREDSLTQYSIEGVNYDPNAELRALSTEANGGPPVNWTQFIASNSRATRIAYMEDRGVSANPVRRIVDGRKAFADESERIRRLDRFTAWSAFQAGRVAYGNNSPLSAAQRRELRQAYDARIVTLRTQVTQAKVSAAETAPASMSWGDFHRRHDITQREGGFTAADTERIRQAFDRRPAAGQSSGRG